MSLYEEMLGPNEVWHEHSKRYPQQGYVEGIGVVEDNTSPERVVTMIHEAAIAQATEWVSTSDWMATAFSPLQVRMQGNSLTWRIYFGVAGRN